MVKVPLSREQREQPGAFSTMQSTQTPGKETHIWVKCVWKQIPETDGDVELNNYSNSSCILRTPGMGPRAFYCIQPHNHSVDKINYLIKEKVESQRTEKTCKYHRGRTQPRHYFNPSRTTKSTIILSHLSVSEERECQIYKANLKQGVSRMQKVEEHFHELGFHM